MRIVFYPQSCVPVHAKLLEERPLGGIETAIIRLAEALHLRGHSVTVYTSDPEPPASEPVYAHLSEARSMRDVDVFVCIREWIPLLSHIPARIKLFWTGDAADQIQNFGIGDKRISNLTDGFLAVSDWQADTISETSGFPREKITVIRNGIHLPFFDQPVERIEKRLIYTSTPFRGLELLPGIFKEIKKAHPDATLAIYSGTEVYQSEQSRQYLNQLTEKYRPVFTELEQIDGVTIYGNVIQSELAKALLASEILCYPNTFAETSCISIMEAQAAGVIPVTSALAALPETVGAAGVLVHGTPGSADYIHNFISAINNLLADPATRKDRAQAARLYAQNEHSWQAVALRLERYLAETFQVL